METARTAEFDRLENGHICWAKGAKSAVPENLEGINEEESTNSTITTEASKETAMKEGRIVRREDASELEKIKTDIMDMLNKDQEERTEL